MSVAKGFPATKINRNRGGRPAAMVSRGSSSIRRPRCGWTNERHVNFLNSMEASFVRTIILQNNNNVSSAPPPPPLDRYIPDSSDSTLDLNNQTTTMPPRRRRRHYYYYSSTSDILDSTRIRIDERNRRLLHHHKPYNIWSQDQVVPQFESTRADDNDTDKKDRQLDVAPPN